MSAIECCELVHVKPNGSDGMSYPVCKDAGLILGRSEIVKYTIKKLTMIHWTDEKNRHILDRQVTGVIFSRPLPSNRHPDCDYRVQLPSVSDKHAKLRVDKAGKVSGFNKTCHIKRWKTKVMVCTPFWHRRIFLLQKRELQTVSYTCTCRFYTLTHAQTLDVELSLHNLERSENPNSLIGSN